MDIDIETGSGENVGLLEITLLPLSEWRAIYSTGEDPKSRTALFTARGKDHDMSADQLEKLGKACLKFAKKIREGK